MSGNGMDTAWAIKGCLEYLQVDAKEAKLMIVADSLQSAIAELDRIIESESITHPDSSQAVVSESLG